MKYTMNQLKGMDRCSFRRENKLPSVAVKNTNVIREELLNKCILGFLRKEMSWNDIVKEVNEKAYAEDEGMAAETKRILCEDMLIYLDRYFKSENRIPEKADASLLDIYGIDVLVKPDVFFFDGRTLEIVKYAYKKPDLSQNGHKLDASAKGSLMLYSMLFYGKQLNAYVNPKQKPVTIKASVYYLKKANDNFEKDIFDLDFFDTKNGKNVISLQDTWQYPSSMDADFYNLFLDFKAGQQANCLKENCKYCDLYPICAYHKTPQPLVNESISKSVREVKFTKNQQNAISFERGIARINAGAGAGKTMVISRRVVELLKKGYKPEEICVLSFTNAAAAEMTERITKYATEEGIGNQVNMDNLISMTFNSLGDMIIGSVYSVLGFKTRPILLEEGEKSRIIEELLIDYPISGMNYRNLRADERYLKGALAIAKKVFNIFREYRLQEATSEKAVDFIMEKMDVDKKSLDSNIIEALFDRYKIYDQKLKEEGYIEYCDQEWLLFDLWKLAPAFFQNTGFKHIIIDEFQDSSDRQMGIIKMLCNSRVFTSLMVVGDDSQSIYGFRGTSPKNIIHFFDILGCKGTDFYLLENYRSTPEIIHMANEINKRNKNRIPKDLIATKKSNGLIPTVQAYTSKEEEYTEIVKGIKAALTKGKKAEEIAFIARTKSELLSMKELLDKEKIPCILLNPELTKENPKVQACQALHSFLTHPEDENGMAVYLNCLCGGKFFDMPKAQKEQYLESYKTYAENFQEYQDEQKYNLFLQLANMLLNDGDEVYTHFLEVVQHNKTWGTLCKYFVNFDIYGDSDSFAKKLNYPGVVLTTAHSSKGLEWDVVFNSITKYDNQLIRSDSRSEELEETRRLLFVSVTRAKEELHISGQYYSFGTAKDKNFNLFLKECYEIAGKDIEVEFDKY